MYLYVNFEVCVESVVFLVILKDCYIFFNFYVIKVVFLLLFCYNLGEIFWKFTSLCVVCVES